MVTTVEPKATLSTFLTSDQRHNSLHQDQICHRCPALKLFGLSSNHTHFILEAFVTTSLFMWILPVETVRPVKTLSAVQSAHMDIQLEGIWRVFKNVDENIL